MTLPANITLQGFKDFVKSKSGPYYYMSTNACAFAQYLSRIGYDDFAVGGVGYFINGEYYFMNDIHSGLERALETSSFEDLHNRLEALSPSKS